MAKVFERYKWLADLIQRSGGITFEDIQRAWDRSPLNEDDKPLSERTFHRHKDEIENLFGITIKCHKSSNKYYIENEDEVDEGGVTDWMLSTIAVDNMLAESRDLRDRIQFERIPGGREHLSAIINAMRDGIVLSIQYHNFHRDSDTALTLKPYFLKVFEQRWYVVGIASTHPGQLRTYALDRITGLSQTEERFVYPKDFSPEEFYSNSYGIFHSEEKPVLVKLKTDQMQAMFLDSLPIHRTQRRLDNECTDSYAVYQYYLSPAYDFVQYLVSMASSVEVLEPESLRSAVAEEIRKMYGTYFK